MIAQKKTTISATLFILCVSLIIAFPLLSADTDDDPFESRQRPPVNFLENYHDLHMESQDCLSCHHNYEDGENVLDESELEEGNPDILCAACHGEDSEINLQRAFHRQCIGCHDKLSDENMATGPSLCGECHIRPKQ